MKNSLVIDWVGHAAVKYACETWHYSKSTPTGRINSLGVWENDVFIGVVVFAGGVTRHIASPFRLKRYEVVELCRVALNRHNTAVSKIISIALRMLRNKCPDLHLVVSYADPVQLHVGTIYQAGNWTYIGETKPSYEYRLGRRRLQKRSYTGDNFGRGRLPIPDGAVKFDIPGKHKYIFPLSGIGRQIAINLALPYPKRQPIEGSTDQVDVGGASPTLTLH